MIIGTIQQAMDFEGKLDREEVEAEIVNKWEQEGNTQIRREQFINCVHASNNKNL